MNKPDPRINPWRDDLAAEHLRGEVEAPRFVAGRDYTICAPVTNLHRSPAHGALVDSQLLFGERFRVYDIKGAWAWGQCQFDDYVGYVLVHDLAPPTSASHRVRVPRCHVFTDPDIKSRPIMAISMGAMISATATSGRFTELASGGFIVSELLMTMNAYRTDHVETARQFIGTPYLWGGRESMGIDCSGLVQIALMMAGRACPRDSDMQEASLGTVVTRNPQAGDLIFWKGHVGIIGHNATLIHANATLMQVVEEDLDTAIERIAKNDDPVTSIRRLAR